MWLCTLVTIICHVVLRCGMVMVRVWRLLHSLWMVFKYFQIKATSKQTGAKSKSGQLQLKNGPNCVLVFCQSYRPNLQTLVSWHSDWVCTWIPPPGTAIRGGEKYGLLEHQCICSLPLEACCCSCTLHPKQPSSGTIYSGDLATCLLGMYCSFW